MQAPPRRRPTRPILLAAGIVLVLGGGLYVLAATLNPDQLREDLQEAVRRQTGRDLQVAGGVHLRLGLSPEFVLDEVSLANAPGASRPQMFTARHVRARLALLPLLAGDAVISALTVEQPDLLLERTADGTPNWAFAPERRALYQGHGVSGGGSGSGGGGGHRVEIRSVTFVGGQLGWQPQAGAPTVLAIDRLRLSADGADSPMSLSFEGSERGARLTVTATSGSLQRLQGGVASAVAGPWPLDVDAATQGATLHVGGGFTHPDQARGYQLRARLTAPALGQLNALLPDPILPPLAQVEAAVLLTDGGDGEIRTSQLSVHAGASDLSAWVAGLSVKQAQLSAPGPGQLAQLTVDGSYQDQALRATATAMQPDIVGAGGPVQVSVDVQAAGASLSAHGTMPPGLGTSGLDMQVSLHAPDLSLLSPLAGRPLPPARDVAMSAGIGDAGVKLRGVAVRNLAVTSSLGDLSGNLTAVWSPRLDFDGTLSARVLDLDALLPGGAGALPAIWPEPQGAAASGTVQPMPAPDGVPPQPAPEAVAAGRALPLARLRTTDANLNLSVGDLTLGGRHYSDVQAQLQLEGGKLALNPFRAQAPEGQVDGGISIDASSDDPPVAVTLRSPSLAAGAVATALGYPGGASGTMQVDAQLSGVGQTLQALESSLDGHLGLALVDGQVDDSLVQGLIGAALNTAGVPSFGGGGSQVRCFAMRVDFRHGEGTLRALSADTSRLALDGGGRIDLGTGTADLHLRPRVRLGPTEVAAPVSLRGPFGGMRAALDPVMGGGRYGLTIGSGPAGPSDCAGHLALARGGLGGPMPAVAPAAGDPNAGFVIRKPKDLLKGLFH
jgi:AsmA protein